MGRVTLKLLGCRLLITGNSTIALVLAAFALVNARASGPASDLLRTQAPEGIFGGSLVVLERSGPKTLNPVIALDAPSRDVIRRMMADLITINRRTLETEPSLAKSWTVSKDGREFVVQLRRGLRFSDGQPMDADDVVFTFQVYLDEKIHSPQRDLLIVGGQPIHVEKLDPLRVRFRLAQPYAAAERIFDSLAILPRHLLETPWREGKLAEAWNLNTAPGAIAGMGPFRLKQYVPGEKIVLERNPYYWKTDRNGTRLPYLDQLEFRFVSSEDSQVAALHQRRCRHLESRGRPQFRIAASGCAHKKRSAYRSWSRAGIQLPLFQLWGHSMGGSTPKSPPTRTGFAMSRSGKLFPRRWTATPSFAWFMADVQRLYGGTSLRPTASGAIRTCRIHRNRSNEREAFCVNAAFTGPRTAP